jgi:hypothetical protein
MFCEVRLNQSDANAPVQPVRRAATLLAAFLDGALTLAMQVVAAFRALSLKYHSVQSRLASSAFLRAPSTRTQLRHRL